MSSTGGAPKLRFRNYQPKHSELRAQTDSSQQHAEAPSKVIQKEISEKDQKRVQEYHQKQNKVASNQKNAAANADYFENQEDQERLQGKEEDEHQITIAPKKENWDLKREIKPKLDRLEKQTQTAIAELVREKVQNETRAENS